MPLVASGGAWVNPSSPPFVNAASVWDAATQGNPPAFTIHANMGTGATYTLDGNRFNAVLTITTGPDLTQGGIAGTFVLLNFSSIPMCKVNARDEDSLMAHPILKATSSTSATLTLAGGDLQPGTTYSFDVMFAGK